MGEPYGGKNLWVRTDDLEDALGNLSTRMAVIEQRFTSIERTQTRIVAMLTSVLVAIVASGIGVVLTVVLTKR